MSYEQQYRRFKQNIKIFNDRKSSTNKLTAQFSPELMNKNIQINIVIINLFDMLHRNQK